MYCVSIHYKDSFVVLIQPILLHSWCQPCKILGPNLEKAVKNYKDKVLLAKVDVDENGEIAMAYDVSESIHRCNCDKMVKN